MSRNRIILNCLAVGAIGGAIIGAVALIGYRSIAASTDSFINLDLECDDLDGDGWSVCDHDCNDDNWQINPGAPLICSDPVDRNCNNIPDLHEPSCKTVRFEHTPLPNRRIERLVFED